MENKSDKGIVGDNKGHKQSPDDLYLDKDSSDIDLSKKLMNMILEVFHDKEWKYTQNLQQLNKSVYLRMEKDNQPFFMDVRITQAHMGYKIQIRSCFGFRVELPATAIIRCFIVEFNNKYSNFANMNLNDDGAISIRYSYLVAAPEEFNKNVFLAYFREVMSLAPLIYSQLSRYSIGVVTKEEDRLRYKTLLEQGLVVLRGTLESDEDVSYGIDDLDSKINKGDFDEKKDAKQDDKKGTNNGTSSNRNGGNIESENRLGFPTFAEYMKDIDRRRADESRQDDLQKKVEIEDRPSRLGMFDDTEGEHDQEGTPDSGGE